MEEELETGTFVIGGNKRYSKDKYSDKESYYFSQNSTRKLFEGLIVAGYLIKRFFFSWDQKRLTSVKFLVDNEQFEDNPYLASLYVTGAKRGLDSFVNDFQLSLRNRLRNEKEIKDVGPYREYHYYYSWVEVVAKITTDENIAIKTIESIVRKSTNPAFSSNKTEMDHGGSDGVVKEEFFGKGINEKKEKEERYFNYQKNVWEIEHFDWMNRKWQLRDVREQKKLGKNYPRHSMYSR